jgi:hypothetical protein
MTNYSFSYCTTAFIAIVTLCLWGALPAAVAIFPQKGVIDADKVEEGFRNLMDKKGQRIEKFTYNKGI